MTNLRHEVESIGLGGAFTTERGGAAMIGHDDPTATMSLDEFLADHPCDPSAMMPPAEFLAHVMGLASEAEREWFRLRIVGPDPTRMEIPGVDELVRLYSGLAINARNNGLPFKWVWESVARALNLAEAGPSMADAWGRIRDAMAIMSVPNWSPR